MIKKLTFSHFKGFKSKQTLDIRPITIIIGKNNSGKSSLLRLLVMLQESIKSGKFVPNATGESPLVYKCDKYYFADTLQDLAYGRNLGGSKMIDLEIEFYEPSASNLKLSLDYLPDSKYELFAKYEQNGQIWEFDSDSSTYTNTTLPASLPNFNANYQPPLRPNLERDYHYHKDKKSAVFELFDNNILLSKVSAWYEKNMNLGQIKIMNDYQKYFSLYASSPSGANINLADTGHGIGQSLPIVVAALSNHLDTLHIIEQPELHLHPAAHAAIGSLFVESIHQNPSNRFLIETHSENLILRLQRLRAEGILNETDLGIYFVDYDPTEKTSFLKEILVDNAGETDWWPEGVFSEDFEEVKAIRQAQKKQLK